ncbi:Aste57867_24358 [Aphanomyces stellatus]|uniref:Aste57867_24358 protein n=1 Tax=Aphanomyces stellatus TaxID=120398 RepID=A0A485LRB2_9STRA|nr:hypothetical protein As57867_024282 [Aphanomyces stellatus]VFU00998.1 Aste57867_24358 [Aphanomyces stellatus]
MTTSPPLGLTLGFFHRFMERHGGRQAFLGLSTADVCETFVKPYTRGTQLSLVEHVHRDPQDGPTYVKPAAWFVSHAWSYLFLDVVDALDAFFNGLGIPSTDDVPVWFCTFNNNQHEVTSHMRDFQYWVDAFKTALTSIGRVVMVLCPWNNPTTLTRTWCVFELYVAIVTKARFEVAMGTAQKQAFLRDIHDANAFKQMLGTIKSENSQTAIATDRHNILDTLAEANVSFSDLDRMLFDVLEDWMIRTVQDQIKSTELAVKAQWMAVLGEIWFKGNAFDKAQQAFEDAVQIHRQELASNDPEMWRYVANAAYSAGRRDKSRDVWEPMFQQALDNQLALLGNDHADTLNTMLLWGQCNCNHGNFEAGVPLLKSFFDIHSRVVGSNHPKTLEVMNSIGRAHLNQNQLQDAEFWFTHCYDRKRQALGDEHPDTVESELNLGVCFIKQGKYTSATATLLSVYKKRCRLLGPTHESTFNCYNTIGQLHALQGHYAQAEFVLVECVDTAKRLQLRPHRLFLSLCRLGMYFASKGDIDKANKYLGQAHDGFIQTYNPAHFEAQRALYWRCLVLMTSDGWHSLAQIAAYEDHLRLANCFNETWSRFPCHGCYQPIQGQYFTCTKCPKFAWCFCGSCVASSKRTAFCDHGLAEFMALKPPARLLQEKKLEILAQDLHTNRKEYQNAYEAYQAYCIAFQVPEVERLKSMGCSKSLWLYLWWLFAGPCVVLCAVAAVVWVQWEEVN